MIAADRARRRILVVEDETMIAMMIEQVLEDLQCDVVGPASRLDAAMQLARDEAIDGALLDVTVRGGQIFPVAEILVGRRIPFILASGYGEWALPDAFKDVPRLEKPFTVEQAARAIEAISS